MTERPHWGSPLVRKWIADGDVAPPLHYPELCTRNLVDQVTAERNRTDGPPGAYTFNTLPPDRYEGVGFAVGVIRVGDHAHVEFRSGRIIAAEMPYQSAGSRLRMGAAGKLVLRWHEWLALRTILEPQVNVRIAEVEKPTPGMVERYAG